VLDKALKALIHLKVLQTSLYLVLSALIAFSAIALSAIAEGHAKNNGTSGAQPETPVSYSISSIKPWGMNVNGVNQGILIEFVQALERETGLPYRVSLRPYARVFQDLYSGEADMGFVFDSPNIIKRAIRIGTVMNTTVSIVGPAGSTPYRSMSDLKGLSVGVMRGSKYGQEFDSFKDYTKVRVNTINQGVSMLMAGRLDAMVATSPTLEWGMRNSKANEGDLTALLVIQGPVVGLYLSRKSIRPQIEKIYREALERLNDGRNLSKRYSPKPASTELLF